MPKLSRSQIISREFLIDAAVIILWPSGTKAAVRHQNDSSISIYDMATRSCGKTFVKEMSLADASFHLSPDESMFAYQAEEGISVVDAATETQVWLVGPKGDPIVSTTIGISNDRSNMLVFRDAEQISLWDLRTGTQICRMFEYSCRQLQTFAFSRANSLVAAANYVGEIWIWELSTGKICNKLSENIFNIWSLQFSNDGTQLLSSMEDGFARLWDISTGEIITKFDCEYPVCEARFSRDNQLVMTRQADRIMLWDVDNVNDIVVAISIQPSADHRFLQAALTPDMNDIIMFLDWKRVSRCNIASHTSLYRRPRNYAIRLIHGLRKTCVSDHNMSTLAEITTDYVGYHVYAALRREKKNL
eukprot:comp19222_c0_seq1/m.35961 comp19222_c0_seq1/g.35961  ORF comp19222_c0_seq1/g.35961 comp19222_c0_seq1/m.35961 type:complete len:360 (+) comp19222_c0_seq1:163-1242(+)